MKVMSGEAKPGPAIGQALGPLGLNMAECSFFKLRDRVRRSTKGIQELYNLILMDI